MPTYLGGSISISLSHADLEKTLTRNPVRRVGKEVRENLEAVQEEFSNHGIRLQEQTITPEGGDLSLRFLGEAQDMPFYMMKAGQRLHHPSRPESPSIEKQSPDNGAQITAHATSASTSKLASHFALNRPFQSHERRALNLTVSLTPSAFLPQPTCTVPSKQRPQRQDVKVDVFLNGARCACTYFPARSLGSRGLSHLSENFHGQRVDLSIEKPWIMVPVGQNPDGSLREHRRSKWGSSKQRLAAINSILLSELETFNTGNPGRDTVLGEYLRSLACVELPNDFQPGGAARFGVIDVVLTAGLGKKDDAWNRYLMKPASARLSRLEWSMSSNSRAESNAEPGTLVAPTVTEKVSSLQHGSILEASPDSFACENTSDVERTMTTRSKRKYIDSFGPVVTPQASLTPDLELATDSPLPSDFVRPSESPLVAKRRRVMEGSTGKHSGAYTAPPSTSAKGKGCFKFQPTHTKTCQPNTNPQHSTSLAHAGPNVQASSPQPQKVAILKVPPSRLRSWTQHTADKTSAPEASAPLLHPDGAQGSCLPASQSRIDEDCIVTYEPTGLRQIRKERGWWFKEGGVILGVRYIVVPT